MHPAGNLLATAPAGIGALSAGMAGALAVPDCWHRRGRSPGTGERDYLSTGETFARKSSRLERAAQRLVRGFRVRNHFQRPVAHGSVNGLAAIGDGKCWSSSSVGIAVG